MEITIIELSAKQQAAIKTIKHIYGEHWKKELKKSWWTGVYSFGMDSGEIAELQRLRNTIGNKGLEHIK